jgi:gluconokinase
LNDQDRQPWLEAVAGWIDERLAAGEPGIITCSNLKRAYRQITVGDRKGVTLVYLQGDEPLIAARNQPTQASLYASLAAPQSVRDAGGAG